MVCRRRRQPKCQIAGLLGCKFARILPTHQRAAGLWISEQSVQSGVRDLWNLFRSAGDRERAAHSLNRSSHHYPGTATLGLSRPARETRRGRTFGGQRVLALQGADALIMDLGRTLSRWQRRARLGQVQYQHRVERHHRRDTAARGQDSRHAQRHEFRWASRRQLAVGPMGHWYRRGRPAGTAAGAGNDALLRRCNLQSGSQRLRPRCAGDHKHGATIAMVRNAARASWRNSDAETL